MKSLIAIAFVLSSFAAQAEQQIVCRQVNKNGQLTANGGKIEMFFELTSRGQVNKKQFMVVMSNFSKSSVEISLQSVSQSHSRASSPYTTFSFDSSTHETLEIQLRFKDAVVGKSFRNVPAVFSVGSEDANPETGFGFGYDLVCNGRFQ